MALTRCSSTMLPHKVNQVTLVARRSSKVPKFFKSFTLIHVGFESCLCFHFIRRFMYTLCMVVFFTLQSKTFPTSSCTWEGRTSNFTPFPISFLFNYTSVKSPLNLIKSTTLNIGEILKSDGKSTLLALVPYFA